MKGNCIDCICMQMYFETWKYMFLRRSLASLARAYKLHVHDFFSSVGTFGGLAPQYQKAGYATGTHPPPPPPNENIWSAPMYEF